MTKRLIRWAEERINWAPEMWNMFIFCEYSVVIGDKKECIVGDRR